jgi:hypothetical protein
MKKHHWHVFQYEKLFEKQPLPHCQTHERKRHGLGSGVAWWIHELMWFDNSIMLDLIKRSRSK